MAAHGMEPGQQRNRPGKWIAHLILLLVAGTLAILASCTRIGPHFALAPAASTAAPSLDAVAALPAAALAQPALASEPLLQAPSTPTARPLPSPVPTMPPAPPLLARPIPTPRVTAQMAVLIDERSGAILWGQDEHREVAPASLTKIMTAMVAIERGQPGARVTTDVDSRVMWDSTRMGLLPGEQVSLEDLLYGLMLPSGNDAALAIARYIGGSDDGFVDLMNARVQALGLQHTQFRNPHGLDADGHYSSPYDMAMMARAAMRNPLFQRLAAAKEWECSGLLQSYRLTNLNRLLWRYPGADGVKIGYTDDAGRTMVVSAIRDGHRVYASFMRSRDLVADGSALLDYAFDAFAWGPPTRS